MSESEWLKCLDDDDMLTQLRDQASLRKLRCYALHHLARLAVALNSKWLRHVAVIVENHAQTTLEAREAEALRNGLLQEYLSAPNVDLLCAINIESAVTGILDLATADQMGHSATVCRFARDTVRSASEALVAVGRSSEATEWDAQTDSLRDIFGNPFRPVTLDPSWLTSAVKHLAHVIYDDRAFDRLPILADALEDAGCTDPDILAHCRGPGPHVRGCWVVDLLLAKN